MIKSNKKAITDLGRVKAGRTEPTIYAQWIGAKLDKIESLLIELRATASKPLDLGGGAAYLHISKSHLYQLTSKGLIAHFKPAGKKIYFQKFPDGPARENWPGMTYFVVRPKWVRYCDYNPGQRRIEEKEF